MNIAKCLRALILKNGCFCTSNRKVSNEYLASACRPSLLLNQRHAVGWFLLRRFVDLVRVYSQLIISRNHQTFLLISLQKIKTCPK